MFLQALFHLRPQLIKMEAKLKDKQKFDESDLPTHDDVEELMKQNEESSPSETDEDEGVDDSEMCTIVCDGQEQKEGDQPRQRRSKPKSVVSQIHECAYRLKLNVEFEVVKETGEPVSLNKCKINILEFLAQPTLRSSLFLVLASFSTTAHYCYGWRIKQKSGQAECVSVNVGCKFLGFLKNY